MTQMRWRHRGRARPLMNDGALPAGSTGAPRGAQRLLSLVDTADPAFADIVAVLRDYAAAGGELDEDTARGAVRLGRERHARRTGGDTGTA
jgi:hypothetical protein